MSYATSRTRPIGNTRTLTKVAPCAWTAESESDPGRIHMVAFNPDTHTVTCTCEAARYGRSCWHRTQASAQVWKDRSDALEAQQPQAQPVEVTLTISIDANGVTVR